MSAPLPPPAERAEWLFAPDGVRLHLRAWEAPAPRAALLVSHGLGEHSGRYAALARDLVPRGVSVYALDHRGHGRSGGARGHADRFECFTGDFECFRRAVLETLPPGLPVFLLGHSLGGLIAIRHLETHPDVGWRGAILSAPMLGAEVKVPKWKEKLSGVLSNLLPRLPFGNEIDPSGLSTDAANVKSYREDPLVHSRITPRLYTEMMEAVGRAWVARDLLPRPLLFLVPGADPIVRSADTLRFAADLAGDVTVREYPGFRHESLSETDRARAVGDVVAWMEERMGA
ncbi:MAG TPA: alpha/beta hydrolase [Longimicrobium sp.]|nr:alpha/beta hydrolase [Longimicrobium sp.]